MSRPVPDVSHLVLAHYLIPIEDSVKTVAKPRRVFLDWWVDRPFTVQFEFQDTDGWRTWLVSRELLAAGLEGPAGVGDVQLFPSLDQADCTELVLSCPAGQLGALFTQAALSRFLEETYGHVPAGCEVLPESWFEELIRS